MHKFAPKKETAGNSYIYNTPYKCEFESILPLIEGSLKSNKLKHNNHDHDDLKLGNIDMNKNDNLKKR